MVIQKITPFKAVLICLNSMIGAGLFISVQPLTQLAGPLGFLSYLIAAVILFPIVLCIAELASLHPVAGGLYVYSKTYVGSWAGFVSAWGYFVGKTVSVALLMHKFNAYFYTRSSWLQPVPLLFIDFVVLFFIAGINAAGISIGGRVQYFFTTLKSIPVLFAFGVGFFLFDPTNFKDIFEVTNLIYAVPIAILPLLGVEVICAITNMVEDASRNIKRIIITAFAIVATINTLFQLTTFGIIGSALKLTGEPVLAVGFKALAAYPYIAQMINGAVFASVIGACFSLLTSNCWNLHTIARYKHLPAGSFLTKINRNNVPWTSLLVEVVLGCLILWITVEQIPLQNMSVFAQVISYILTSLAAWYAVRTGATQRISKWVPVLAMAGCGLVLGICLHRIISFGVSFPFLFILCAGLVAAGIQKLFFPGYQ
jgi:APA family basic amino acid/polyamine antiporter